MGFFDWIFAKPNAAIATLQQEKREVELELEAKKTEILVLTSNLQNNKEKYAELEKQVKILQDKITYMEQLEKKVPVSELKSYFLSKWREGNVLWNFQSQGSQDVKIALRETVEDKAEFKKIAQKIISDYNLSKKPIDSIPRYVMDWREDYFNRNTYYKSDLTTFGKSDYWQRGGLTLKNYKNGYDCDDMAIVMHLVILHILEELGLSEHSWRLKMCCSDTILGGHAYNLWLADDIEWYSIESTLGVTEAMRNWLSRPMRYNGLYQTIWFTFTKERTYADTDLMFDKADYFKKTGEN